MDMLSFMEGQCFNFAVALSQCLRNSHYLSLESLVSITSFREEGEEEVCIHCLLKGRLTLTDETVYLDAEGIHSESYADEIGERWQSFEQNIENKYRCISIDEYSLDKKGIESYWVALSSAGAYFKDDIIIGATQYIFENQKLFEIHAVKECYAKHPL